MAAFQIKPCTYCGYLCSADHADCSSAQQDAQTMKDYFLCLSCITWQSAIAGYCPNCEDAPEQNLAHQTPDWFCFNCGTTITQPMCSRCGLSNCHVCRMSGVDQTGKCNNPQCANSNNRNVNLGVETQQHGYQPSQTGVQSHQTQPAVSFNWQQPNSDAPQVSNFPQTNQPVYQTQAIYSSQQHLVQGHELSSPQSIALPQLQTHGSTPVGYENAPAAMGDEVSSGQHDLPSLEKHFSAPLQPNQVTPMNQSISEQTAQDLQKSATIQGRNYNSSVRTQPVVDHPLSSPVQEQPDNLHRGAADTNSQISHPLQNTPASQPHVSKTDAFDHTFGPLQTSQTIQESVLNRENELLPDQTAYFEENKHATREETKKN